MIAIIKDVCIFMVVAQAALLFVPGKEYMKYVRILVGIIMILKITEPIFGLLLDEEQKLEIRETLSVLEGQMEVSDGEPDLGDGGMSIYEGIEEELRGRIESSSPEYEAVRVELSEDADGREGQSEPAGGIDRIIITVNKRAETQKQESKGKRDIWVEPIRVQETEISKEEGEELQALYADSLGVESERVEIRYE